MCSRGAPGVCLGTPSLSLASFFDSGVSFFTGLGRFSCWLLVYGDGVFGLGIVMGLPMGKFVYFLVLGLFSVSARAYFPVPAKVDPSEVSEVVYQGTALPPEEEAWRYVVRIGIGYGACTATIIRDDMILTAAHCLKNQRLNETKPDIDVQFFKHTILSDSKKFKFGSYRFFIAPKYMTATTPEIRRQNDLAILQFNEKIVDEDFKSIPYYFNDIRPYLPNGTKVFAIGAGSGAEPGVSSSLSLAGGKIVSIDGSSKSGFSLSSVIENSQGLCAGDSGGPLLIKNATGAYSLIGVASQVSTDMNERCGTLTFHTAVFSEVHAKWISSIQKRTK